MSAINEDKLSCDGSEETKKSVVERIILVHGTFAAEPADHGQAWFQLGSPFVTYLESRLPRSIRVTDKVFHWTGENLESHRQVAAARLLGRVLEFNESKTPVHLVGHSHGAIAIWAMLCLAAEYKLDLPNLRSWTTVGAPFIDFTLRRVSLLTTSIGWKWLGVSLVLWLLTILLFHIFIALTPAIFISLTVVFGVGGWVNVIVQSSKMLKNIRSEAAKKFGPKGKAITSSEDEVIPFLNDMIANRLRLFRRPHAQFKSVIEYEVFRSSQVHGLQLETGDFFHYSYGDELATGQPGYLDPSRRRILRPKGETLKEEFDRQAKARAIRAGIFWPFDLYATLIVQPCRHLLAAMADHIVHSRLLTFAFGNDTLAYRPKAVSVAPHSTLHSIVSLISEAGNKLLLQLADSKAASLISVARRNLIPSALFARGDTPLSKLEAVPLDLFVHTSYFEVDEVRDEITSHIMTNSSHNIR